MEREEVIRNLRACLLSIKGGLKLEHLSQDYKTLVNENIPFRKLGYASLAAFLQTVPGIRALDKGGQCIVEALPTQESAHLTKLVAQQKQGSKKSRKKVKSFPQQKSPRKPISFRLPKATKPVPYPSKSGNVIQSQQQQRQQVAPHYQQTQHYFPPPQQQNQKLLPQYQQPQHQLPQYQQPKHQPSQHQPPQRQPALHQPPQHQLPQHQPSQHQQLQHQQTQHQLPQRQQTTQYVQNTMKENKDPKNGMNLPTPTPQFQVLSPLSPAKLLSGRIAQAQSKPVPQPLLSVNTDKNILPKSPPASDARLELLARANILNLPDPVYKILPTKIQHAKEPSIFAQVKIGPHGYGSYPKEARTEDEAQKIAAEVALLDLTEKYGGPAELVETRDKNVIRDRVLAIVNSHSNGVFLHEIPILYKQQYKEMLALDWQAVIENCPSIVLEDGVDNRIILRRFTLPTTPVKDVISPKKGTVQLNSIGPAVPGQLELPQEDVWIVSVTCVMSTTEVWVRLVDDAYSEKFYEMSTDMAQHYSKVQTPVKSSDIEVGCYYAIFEDESWHRVRCMDYNVETGLVTVSFVDLGDGDCFPSSKLYVLEKQFCQLPAQAFRVSLSGLEEFSECDLIITEIEKRLLYRPFYIEIIGRDTHEDAPHATVVFYDTEGPEDINLNAAFLKQILESIVTVPKLDEDRQVSEVFVSHIQKNGDIYVQVQSESMKYLVNLLNRLINSGINAENLKQCTAANINMKKTYFALVDGNWYRGKIIERFFNKLKVFLIDFGKTVLVEDSSLLPLENLSDILAEYPSQVLKVHLHNIDNSMFNEKMAARLSELAPEGEPLLAKVVKSSVTDVPVVELLKRIEPNNLLVSINNTLVYEEEFNSRMQGDGNNNIKPRRRVERTNSKPLANEDEDCLKTLKPPKIPVGKEFFDVHVTMAAHPGNFIVQPFSDKNSLQEMMVKLQQECQAYKGPALVPSAVIKGKLFAAQHRDGHWYRVCVSSNIIRENMVSVYYCDFGDVSVLPLSSLQPLKRQFFELPYQAIKARLVGIRPVNVDWSVEDSLRFQELVVEKDFVSMVVESAPDGVSPADTVLGLKLINVDTNEDVYIDQLLVQEGRAVFIDA